MKRKVIASVLATVTSLVMVLSGCGGNTANNTAQGTTEAGSSAQTQETTESKASGSGVVRLVNNKAEIQEGLQKLAAKYESETGVTIEIDTIGGGQDTQAVLKNYYQADNMPDIFVFEGDTHYETWQDILVDLTGEKWTEDTDAEYVHD